MWVVLIVVLEPRRQLGQDGLSIRTIVNIDVVSFEGFNERWSCPRQTGQAAG